MCYIFHVRIKIALLLHCCGSDQVRYVRKVILQINDKYNEKIND